MTTKTRETVHGFETRTEGKCPKCERWSIILAEARYCPWNGCDYDEVRPDTTKEVLEARDDKDHEVHLVKWTPGSWWICEWRPRKGYRPLLGPHSTRAAAIASWLY